jgi:hypothetical protein
LFRGYHAIVIIVIIADERRKALTHRLQVVDRQTSSSIGVALHDCTINGAMLPIRRIHHFCINRFTIAHEKEINALFVPLDELCKRSIASSKTDTGMEASSGAQKPGDIVTRCACFALVKRSVQRCDVFGRSIVP